MKILKDYRGDSIKPGVVYGFYGPDEDNFSGRVHTCRGIVVYQQEGEDLGIRFLASPDVTQGNYGSISILDKESWILEDREQETIGEGELRQKWEEIRQEVVRYYLDPSNTRYLVRLNNEMVALMISRTRELGKLEAALDSPEIKTILGLIPQI